MLHCSYLQLPVKSAASGLAGGLRLAAGTAMGAANDVQ